MQSFKEFYNDEVLEEGLNPFKNSKIMVAAAMLLGLVHSTYTIPNIKKIASEVGEKMQEMPAPRALQVQQQAVDLVKTNAPKVEEIYKKAIEAAPTTKAAELYKKAVDVAPETKKGFLDKVYAYIKNNELGGAGIKYHRIYKDHKKNDTIGIGHLVTDKEKRNKTFANRTLTEKEVNALFNRDIKDKLATARRLLPKYNSYSEDLQIKLLDGIFRGDVSKSRKTIELINKGLWEQAAEEFLDNEEYREAVAKGYGTAPRMKKIADAIRNEGKKVEPSTNPQTIQQTTPFY